MEELMDGNEEENLQDGKLLQDGNLTLTFHPLHLKRKKTENSPKNDDDDYYHMKHKKHIFVLKCQTWHHVSLVLEELVV